MTYSANHRVKFALAQSHDAYEYYFNEMIVKGMSIHRLVADTIAYLLRTRTKPIYGYGDSDTDNYYLSDIIEDITNYNPFNFNDIEHVCDSEHTPCTRCALESIEVDIAHFIAQTYVSIIDSFPEVLDDIYSGDTIKCQIFHDQICVHITF